jgi:glycine/D-amino acid oxidase-like deaminating enzyme
MLRALGLGLPTLRLHATAGRTAAVGTLDGAPFPAMGVWASRCSFRRRADGGLTIADGGFREEHDVGWESLRNGPRFLPALAHFWRQTHLRLRADSFPAPRVDACPAPSPARLHAALAELSAMFPSLPPPTLQEAWAGFIDVTPDMLPVVDAGALDGLAIMAGFSGHGLGLAPSAGRLGAALAMRDGGAAEEARPFRLERFTESWWVGPESLV